MLIFCEWALRLYDITSSRSQAVDKTNLFIRSIFLSRNYAYFDSYFSFRDTSVEYSKGRNRNNYKLDRKVIIAKSGPFTYTVVAGVPHRENDNAKYVDHMHEWLSEFRLGHDLEEL